MIARTAAVLVVLLAGAACPASETVLLREDYQVIQRDREDRGSCVVELPADRQGPARFRFAVGEGGHAVRSGTLDVRDLGGGRRGLLLEGIPVGGPYTITLTPDGAAGGKALSFRGALVGDIWLLGGQSNMFGIDVIKEKLPALPYLNMLNVEHLLPDAHWCAAVPPIHRIPEQFAPFILKGQHPEYTDAQVRDIIKAKTPVGGIDCSYFFARKLYAEGHVPIGLVPCAIGGALAYWDPRQRATNRYGFLYRHAKNAGGRVKGLLFFQGEQDAIFGEERATVTKPSLIYPTLTYGQQFKDFVAALRKDFDNPDLPVLFAQVCRHHDSKKERDKGWEVVREAQRKIPEDLANAHCVATVDLDVMDGLHLDYASLKRVGERMAYLALPYVRKGVARRSEIKLKAAEFGQSPKPTIVVEFSGVTGKLRASGRPTGFSLRRKETGENLDWVYKVELDAPKPGMAVLRVASGERRGLQLYYAAGAAPYANLTDENDMAVPAFGPIELK
jgi:sialate O-acetylesterase